MRVYKATNKDMECTRGKGTVRYRLGVPAVADMSHCGRMGLHACEYVLDCLGYYALLYGNRYFLAEAEGDIAEDGWNTRIACTKLTLIRELSNKEIAGEAMAFMVRHPRRGGWDMSKGGCMVAKDSAWMDRRDGIAIARGECPKVKGAAGAHLGLLREENGEIVEAKLFTVDGQNIREDVWYTVEDRMPKEVAVD